MLDNLRDRTRTALWSFRKDKADFGVPAETFTLLDSSKFHIEGTEKIDQKKTEMLAAVQEIGLDKMLALFTKAINEIFSKKGDFKKNQQLIKTFSRAADFVKGTDPTLVENFKRIVQEQYSDTVAAMSPYASPEEFASFEEQLAIRSIMEIADIRNSSFSKAKLIDVVGGYYPKMLERRKLHAPYVPETDQTPK